MKMEFEEFVRMAKEEFGLTVVKAPDRTATFESLFGVSADHIAQYELPYHISTEQFGYYHDESKENTGFEEALRTLHFDASEYLIFAA